MAEKPQASAIRRSRALFLTILVVALVGGASALWPWLSRPSGKPAATPTASPSALNSEQARQEYYRLHPRAEGHWQWFLIGGLLVLLIVIAAVLLTGRKREPEDTSG